MVIVYNNICVKDFERRLRKMNKKILSAGLVFSVALGLAFNAVPEEKASAAIAFLYDKKAPDTMLTAKKAKTIYVGGAKVDIDYSIGGKTSGIKGTWASSDTAVVGVNKDGKVKAVGNGTAIISFTYTAGGVKKTIKCKVKAGTRAEAVTLSAIDQNFDGNMSTNSALQFYSELKPNSKALSINPDIRSTYKTFYEIFIDEACNNPAPLSLATVSATGLLTSGEEVGKVYVRAVGKSSVNAKTGIVTSTPVAVTINGRVEAKQAASNKIKVTVGNTETITSVTVKDIRGAVVSTTSELSADKRVLTATASRDLTETCTVAVVTSKGSYNLTVKCETAEVREVKLSGTEAPLATLNAGTMTAQIGYKLLDQFGNDVTKDLRFAGKTYAVWENNTRANILNDGRISIPLAVNQIVGYVGNLKVTYAGTNVIEVNERIKIGNPSYISNVEVMGIYRRTVSGYTKVLDANTYLQTGTVINSFGGSSTLNIIPDSYYVLVRAKDNYGNSIYESGIDPTKVGVIISTNTGLELDVSDGKSYVQSIAPIAINGESFLTYPLKAATLKEGTVNIRVFTAGNGASNSIDSKVSNGAAAGVFILSGEGKLGVSEGSLISYMLYSANNTLITKYEDVIATLGLNDYGAGTVTVLPGSSVIYSPNNSIFTFKKNPVTGAADLYYAPSGLALANGMTQNIEEVIVYKGTPSEKKYYLTVKR